MLMEYGMQLFGHWDAKSYAKYVSIFEYDHFLSIHVFES